MLIKKISYLVLVAVFTSASSLAVHAQAENNLEKTYASACEFVKADFKNTIRPDDLKTRLDKGRIYEKIINDQLLIYGRLKANNQYRDNLKVIVQNQQDNLTSFKLKFESYDDVLKQILAINCQTESSSTLSLVLKARGLRAEAQSILDNQRVLTESGLASLSDISTKTEPRASNK